MIQTSFSFTTRAFIFYQPAMMWRWVKVFHYKVGREYISLDKDYLIDFIKSAPDHVTMWEDKDGRCFVSFRDILSGRPKYNKILVDPKRINLLVEDGKLRKEEHWIGPRFFIP